MLSAIFLSGLLVGVGITLLAVRQGMLYGIHHPEEMPVRVVARLRRPLSLSDEQADRIESIIRQRQVHLQEIRRRYQPEVEAELGADLSTDPGEPGRSAARALGSDVHASARDVDTAPAETRCDVRDGPPL
jgi:hypothetical protein